MKEENMKSSTATWENTSACGDLDESYLIDAAKTGDQHAFSELHRRTSDRLLNHVYRITKNWEDAEDVVQQSYINAYRSLNRFDCRSAFFTWIHRIGTNCALMLLRKKNRLKADSIDAGKYDAASGSTRPWEFVSDEVKADDYLAMEEERGRVVEAIAALPQSLRNVVELRTIDDMSLKEIASTIGGTIPAVKGRLTRARRILKRSVC
jgi:RNA polymerase sigma-70 factor (ECF subfamily)